MERILIVSSNGKATEYLSAFFRTAGCERIVTAASGGEARRIVDVEELDLALIYSPLSDEFGSELACFLAERNYGVIFAVKAEAADEVSARVEDSGVFVIPKPINRTFLHQAVKLVTAAHRRVSRLHRENHKLQSKIEEIRMVDRAKCILIERQNYSEMEAHRYIEKAAMDQRLSRREIAMNILASYHID